MIQKRKRLFNARLAKADRGIRGSEPASMDAAQGRFGMVMLPRDQNARGET
jgi:hypothetical protein